MADTPQNQTAAAPLTPGVKSIASAPQVIDEPSVSELLAQELAAPVETPKENKKATKRPAALAPEPEEETPEEPEDEEQDAPEDDADPSTDEEDDAEEGEDDASEESETETDEEDDQADDEEEDDFKAPKGLEKIPKGVAKRLTKQAATIKELKAQLAQTIAPIAPTPDSPLADVEKLDALEERVKIAKSVRDWCRANPDGGTVTLNNGATMDISPEQAQAKLARAEAELDAFPDAKTRLQTREQTKPWEFAEVICPNLYKKGTFENQFFNDILKKVPGLKTGLDNYEVIIAAATRGIVEAHEERTGKARYVRMPLDAKGKPVAPKAVKPTATPQPKPTTAPSKTRPPLKGPGAKEAPNFDDLEVRAASGDESAKRKLLELELAS